MSEIALGVFGVDERNQYGLSLAFRKHEANRYVIDASGRADIVLIDGDALGAAEAITQEMTSRPRRALLVLTLVRQYNLDGKQGIQVLTKPVSVDETLSALDDLARTISGGSPLEEPPPPTATVDLRDSSQEPTDQSPAVNGRRPRPQRSLDARRQLTDFIVDRGDRISVPTSHSTERYDPAQHLDGCLAAIIANAHLLRQRTALVDDGDGISYDPQDQVFTSTGYFDWLDELALSARPCAQYMTNDTSGLFLAKYARRSSPAVLWRAAFLASKGRLRTGVDRNQRLELRHWPNLTQLDYVEGVLPILAAVATRSLGINDLIGEGHGAHVVNATIAGLAAIGALDFGPEIRTMWRARDAPVDRGLIGRLLGR